MKPGMKMMLVANRRSDQGGENRGGERRSEYGGERQSGEGRGGERRSEYSGERGMQMGYEQGVYPRYESGGGEENNFRSPGNRTEYEGRDYTRNEYNGSGINNGAEGRFRDRRGREHYDNGRFAPERRGAMDWPDPVEDRRDGAETPYIRPYLVPTRPRGMGFMSGGIDGSQHMHEHAGMTESHEYPELDGEKAARWTKAMRNADGTTGPHWTQEQAKSLMAQVGASGISPIEFWAVLNAMRSDFQKVAKKHGIDRPDFYADLAKAWLDDKDAVPDKAAAYYEYVVRH